MSEQDTGQAAAPDRSAAPPRERRDLYVKLAFLAVALVGAWFIYTQVQTGDVLKGWPEGVEKALARAKETDRRVLVLFTDDPPGATARRLSRTTLAKPHNVQAIREGKFVRARQSIDSLDSPLARRFAIDKLPTMLILAPDGKEINRREGMIGEVPFREGFLDGSEVVKPGQAGRP